METKRKRKDRKGPQKELIIKMEKEEKQKVGQRYGERDRQTESETKVKR